MVVDELTYAGVIALLAVGSVLAALWWCKSHKRCS
jgi:hypothetical protein